MASAELQEAIAILDAHPSKAHFAGPRAPELVRLAEQALGCTFPADYRSFVKRYGAGNFGAFEVYGVIGDDFQNSSVPNGIWLTLDERRSAGLPSDLAIIASRGDGDWYCVRLSNGGPVILYQPGYPANEQRGEVIAGSFGEFFLDELKAQLTNEKI